MHPMIKYWNTSEFTALIANQYPPKGRPETYVRPVRQIGTKIRSGPVRSAVSDRSRTDLCLDRFDDFFRRRENFDDAKIFEKQVRNSAIGFVQESSTSELSAIFSRLMFENSLATFGRIQPIVPRFIALYPL